MEEVAEALRALEGNTLVLTHHNADIDAVSSALAMKSLLSKLGKRAEAGVAESVSRPAQKLVQDQKFVIDPDCKDYDNVVLVDTSVPEQLASVKNLRADIIVDHHPSGKLVQAAKSSWVDENYSSCAQMVLALFKKMEISLDERTALWIAAGLTADTAHLRRAGLKEFEDMTELLKTGLSFPKVLQHLHTPPSLSERVAVLKAAKRVKIWKIGELLLAVSNVVSHEAAAARAFLRIGADVAVVAAKREKELRISSRGRNNILEHDIDLSVIFKKVGKIIGGSGGGHNLAGSANGPDRNRLDPAIMHIVSELERAMDAKAKPLE